MPADVIVPPLGISFVREAMSQSETKTNIPLCSRFERGLTLIEIIIVVALIGVVLTFLIGKIAGGANKAKVGLSTAMLKQLKGELEVYKISNPQYPPSLQGIVTDKDQNDAFGNPIQYRVTDGGRAYELMSFGADGKPGGTGVDADIVEKGP